VYGGRFYQVTDAKNEFNDNTYIVFRLITTMFMPVLCVASVLFGNYDKLTNLLLVIFTLIKMSESISDAFYGIIQKNNKFYIIGISLFYKFLFGVGLFTVTNLATFDIRLAALAMLVVNLAWTIFYDFHKVRRRVQWVFLRGMIPKLKELARKSSYLAFFSFAPVFAMNIPRFFMTNIDDQAYFSIFVIPITLFGIIILLIINPMLVPLSSRIQNNDSGITKTIIRMMLYVSAFAMFTLIIAWYIGIQVLTVVFGIDFADYRYILLISIISGALHGLAFIFIVILNIMRRFIQEMWIYIICISVLFLSSAITVKEYGLIAAIIVYSVYNAVSLFLFGLYYLQEARRQRIRKEAQA
jgi:O-antigen/teichoic acid export membrane protein